MNLNYRAARLLALLAAPLAQTAIAQAPCCTVTLRVQVPAGTGTVFVAGSVPALGPWKADAQQLTGAGRERSTQLTLPPGTELEYKFTLGSWEREALGYAGVVPPNYRLTVQRDTVLVHDIADFKHPVAEYIADWKGSGVKGRLVYWTDVASRFLGPTRHVEIWLPPGYDEHPKARYPVLYMSDGQNLFDPRIANTGVDWGVDEAVTRLVDRGVIPPVIVVGVWSTKDRGPEYNPWGDAPKYARFLIEELMPRVDSAFRTRRGPRSTFHMGSSMGGLISFYLATRHPEHFGGCGCLSTHFPLSQRIAMQYFGLTATGTADTVTYIERDIEHGAAAPRGQRYWFDYGTVGLDSTYEPSQQAVRAWLLRQRLREGRDFVMRRYDGAAHNEASWRARLDDPLTFLFGRGGR